MTSHVQELIVMADLPKFAGDPKSGEPYFKPDVDSRTFMRSLENYFATHDIRDDNKKIQILFSLVDKKRGDAKDFVTSYADEPISWARLKRHFLRIYPGLSQEITETTPRLMESKLDEPDMRSGMLKLGIYIRAITETYLEDNNITQGAFDQDSLVFQNNRVSVPAEQPQPPAEDAEGSSRPGPSTRIHLVTGGIKLPVLLENFLMHVVLSYKLPNKVYDKISKVGPQKDTKEFISDTIDAANRYRAKNDKKKDLRREENIWKATPKPPSKREREPSTNRAARESGKSNYKCYNCGKTGHLRRDCKVCAYCKENDHTAKTCAKRIAQAKGKYCSFCKIKDSHNLAECRRKKTSRRSKGRIRMLQTTGNDDGDSQYYDPTVFDSSSESDQSEHN